MLGELNDPRMRRAAAGFLLFDTQRHVVDILNWYKLVEAFQILQQTRAEPMKKSDFQIHFDRRVKVS